MIIPLQRKIRRILQALHNIDRPLTGGELCRITCHGPGTIYPALERLERAGWIERHGGPHGQARYELTAAGTSRVRS